MVKTVASLWIDRDKAVIVKSTRTGMEVRQIGAITESAAQNSDSNSAIGENLLSDGEMMERRTHGIGKHLRNYYDTIIAAVRNAESVLIFGPDPAKTELKHRIKELNINVACIVC